MLVIDEEGNRVILFIVMIKYLYQSQPLGYLIC